MQAPPTTWAVCPDIVTRRLGDLLVVVSLSSNRIFELNHTGARVWEMMTSGFDEPRVVAALTDEFAGQYFYLHFVSDYSVTARGFDLTAQYAN